MDLSQSLQGAGGVGGLLATISNGETYHYFYDGNGNVVQLVKASDGSIAAHYEYDPYGNITVRTGTYADANPCRFSSKYFDQESGLLYYGYRYYAPSMGRWISRDPSEEFGGNNLYTALENNPINKYDPTGLSPKGGVYGVACDVLEAKVRSFLTSSQDLRAWDRFTSGSKQDINLSNQEMESILKLSSKFIAKINQLKSKCESSQRPSWQHQSDIVEDIIGSPWAASIGGVAIKISTNCKCGCLYYAAEIKDYYDFDPKYFSTHRTADAELKVILVHLAQVISQCGWKEFFHIGRTWDHEGSGCHQGGGV